MALAEHVGDTELPSAELLGAGCDTLELTLKLCDEVRREGEGSRIKILITCGVAVGLEVDPEHPGVLNIEFRNTVNTAHEISIAPHL